MESALVDTGSGPIDEPIDGPLHWLHWLLEPFAHQERVFRAYRDRKTFALFWEQGTGKSAVILNIVADLYRDGQQVDALLVIAPNGVDKNWLTDEAPTHLGEHDGPHRVVKWRGLRFRSADAKRKNQDQVEDEIINYRGLAILTMSYDAAMTARGRGLAARFLRRRNAFMVVDESQKIKTPSAQRTRICLGLGRLAPRRWILSGTPLTKSPLDLYSQIRFLDEDFWKKHDVGGVTAMRARFAIIEPRQFGAGRRRVDVIVGYRDVDSIRDWVAPISDRVLKADVVDLPPKVYQKRYFIMGVEQRAAYERMREHYRYEIESGIEVTAASAMTRLLRLHQITSGYLPDPEDPEHYIPLTGRNARLDALLDLVEQVDDKGIIWFRFRYDGQAIIKALASEKIDAVLYDGSVNDRGRTTALERFRSMDSESNARFLVANTATISTGVTLNEAATTIYYNNTFNLVDRLQSEDRNHRIGQGRSVLYVDLMAEDTVDERIVKCLRDKREIASTVLGDAWREWI